MADTSIPIEVLDCVPTSVIVVDGNRRVLHANKAALEVLGVAALGRDLALSLRHPNVLDAVDFVLEGNDEKSGEIVLPVPIPRHLAFRTERLKNAPLDDGSVATVVLNDITAAKKAEEMRVDFVANVSHELRSPLTALIGFIETLRGPASDDSQARTRFLDIMHRESQRMSRLIEDLLSLSRVEINVHVAPKKSVNIEDILIGVIEVLQQQASKRGVTINFEPPSQTHLAIGDPDQLNQVFRNLIENAIKYGGESQSVDVRVSAIARVPGTSLQGVSISVTDHGPGIPKDVIPRLTERFFRVDKARSSMAETGINSTGLGLAIVKHIVRRHRGHLSVESKVGEGSTFTVFLCAAPASAIPAED